MFAEPFVGPMFGLGSFGGSGGVPPTPPRGLAMPQQPRLSRGFAYEDLDSISVATPHSHRVARGGEDDGIALTPKPSAMAILVTSADGLRMCRPCQEPLLAGQWRYRTFMFCLILFLMFLFLVLISCVVDNNTYIYIYISSFLI